MATKNRRLSQSDKIAKRLRGIKAGTGMELKKAVHTVNVYARRIPVTINGFLIAYDATGVVFRHKKTSGSKKTRISTFQVGDVVKVFGQPGEVSSITVLRTDLIATVSGFLSRDPSTGVLKVKDAVTGEITSIFPSDEVTIEAFADEDEKAQRTAKPARGKSKSKKKEEEFEEEDEDEDLDEEDEDEDEDDEDEDLDEEDDEDEDLDEEDDEDEDEESDEDEDEDDEDEDEDFDDEDL